jgi:glycerol-3-phosphate acyltransferase PlsX
MMRRIVLDAMGGDHAPGPEVEGALAAVRERPIEVILVGDEPLLKERLARAAERHPGRRRGKITLRHASQVIAMDEHPGAAFKAKKDSSMRVAFNLVVEGAGDAVVSAGNTGAVLACGLFLMKRLPHLERPGITTVCPTRTGSYCVMLDMGANTEVRGSTLAQFAVLGSTYARTLLGHARPRVAVLSNGEEETKGTEVTREAHRLLAAFPDGDFEFRGYAEGRDVFSGDFDVIVTDGFTGNVALKTFEGTLRFLFETLEAKARRSRRAMVGAMLLKPTFRAIRRLLEPEEHGGAVLLGVDGVAVISHGSSNAKAIKNALFTAAHLAEVGLTPALAEGLARHRRLWEEGAEPPAKAPAAAEG